MMESNTPKDVSAYLPDQEITRELTMFGELYEQKSQLTLLGLKQFVQLLAQRKDGNLVDLYNDFLSIFESKIDPLQLMEILAHVIEKMKDNRIAIHLLERTEPKLNNNKEALALCKTLAGCKLLDIQKEYAKWRDIELIPRANSRTPDPLTALAETKELNVLNKINEIIGDVETMLETINCVTTVDERFYDLASRFYYLIRNFAEYYRTTLRYLTCIDINTLTPIQQNHYVVNLFIAALGANISDLGEFLTHPLLESVRQTTPLIAAIVDQSERS